MQSELQKKSERERERRYLWKDIKRDEKSVSEEVLQSFDDDDGNCWRMISKLIVMHAVGDHCLVSRENELVHL